MDSSETSLKQLDQITLEDTITAIDCCSDYVAVGCLDDTVTVWKRDRQTRQIKLTDHVLKNNSDAMGIVDLTFNKKQTTLITSCMDSTIRLYDLQSQEKSKIECDVMENWKADCYEDTIITGGDSGKIAFFEVQSKEKVPRTLKMGQIFITGVGKAKNKPMVASGNNDGAVHLAVLLDENKDKVISFNNHNKIVRDLCFVDDDTKLLSGADDAAIKMVDIASEKVVHTFQGHKLGVTAMTAFSDDSKIFFSTGFDKVLKTWDVRTNTCVGSTMAATPLWDVRSLGNTLVTGGDSGILYVYSMT